MSFLERQSATDMAKFKFSRRDLPGKLFAIAGALLLPERRSEVLLAPTKVQPKFKIGDLVASDWEPDDDDAPEFATDYGEILGMRWIPKAEGNWTPAHTWVYYVYWTHGTCGSDTCYPCYDGEPTRACDLRLVSAEEVCKH
jgi:hypothetical protein